MSFQNNQHLTHVVSTINGVRRSTSSRLNRFNTVDILFTSQRAQSNHNKPSPSYITFYILFVQFPLNGDAGLHKGHPLRLLVLFIYLQHNNTCLLLSLVFCITILGFIILYVFIKHPLLLSIIM